jgi:hypothetical protein
MTSDQFFERETCDRVFGRAVDLSFIDGLHVFQQVLRDFIAVERWSAPSSTIVLHDCLPVTRIAARVQRETHFWVGDTWKVLECLLDYRPDLDIALVPTAPSGLAVVRRLDPRSTVLVDAVQDILARYIGEYPHQPEAWSARYRLTSNDDAGLSRALGVT